MRKFPTHKGNALLIAILLTSVLVLITLGLSRLVNNETFQIAELIRSGKSEYLAESGSEIALYQVHTEEPGFQPEEDKSFKLEPDNEEETFSYKIISRTSTLPIVPDYLQDEAENNFDSLALGESVQIALIDDVPGNKSFEVEYYLPAETGTGVATADWDILLWKLFGENTNTGYVDSLSEYFPAAPAAGSSGGDFQRNSTIGKSANAPASFGSINDGNTFNCGTYFPYSTGEEGAVDIFNSPEERTENKRCQNFISEFLLQHKNNYLVLTNAINLAQINFADVDKEQIANIKYRICTPDCRRPSVNGLSPIQTQIFSEGKFGQNIKSLSTSVNPEGFLPVFDFSIYRTAD